MCHQETLYGKVARLFVKHPNGAIYDKMMVVFTKTVNGRGAPATKYQFFLEIASTYRKSWNELLHDDIKRAHIYS